MTFERLEALSKTHYQTRCYNGHRFHMGRELSARLMQKFKPDIGTQELTKLRDTVFGAPLLHELMGIPIIIDVEMQTNPLQWILVDATGEEIERGTVPPEQEFQWSYGPTSWDAEPGMKWHKDCGGNVMMFDGVDCCTKCGEYDRVQAGEADAETSTETREHETSGAASE